MTAVARHHLVHFEDGGMDQRDLLGGKGANLCEITKIGLPVPPGFVITTDACRAYLAADATVPEGLWKQVGDGRPAPGAGRACRPLRPPRSVGVCGEHGGDPQSITWCDDAGLDYVSCSPFRLPTARRAAAHAALGRTGPTAGA